LMPPITATVTTPTGQQVTTTLTFTTLDPQWIFLGLGVTIVLFFFLGIRTFRSRVVS